MNTVVLVVGTGLLADRVCEELAAQCQIVRQDDFATGVPEAAKLALILHDTWHPYVHLLAEEVFQTAGIPWLRGFVSFGEGVIGPLVCPSEPGCSQCADMRRLIAGRERKHTWDLVQSLTEHGGMPRDAWASRTGLLQVAHLIVADVQKLLQDSPAQSKGHLYLLNLKTLKSSRHYVLPHAMCPVCSRLPNDSPDIAALTLQPSLKIKADSYRVRPMDDVKGFLVKDYLDQRIGLMNGKTQDLVSPFADVIVNVPLFNGNEGTAGRTLSYAQSELTAILEGLERYGGVRPRGKRTTVHDSYRNLEDRALNPVTVGVHAKEQYARPDFPFQEFDPDRPIDWVWGYSFLQERPILVPEILTYYSLGCEGGFVYETSNGCAVGGSLEEAIFYGIMEVVERDSFLMTWYAQLTVPRVDTRSIDDQELQLMIDRLRAVAGYDLYLFNTTMEHGIPSVWVVAKNRKQHNLNLICAAAAHLDPVRAVKGAIHELAGLMIALDGNVAAHREEIAQMIHDPFLVKQMDDHALLYGLPEAEERLAFLLENNRPMRTFDEEFMPPAKHADLTDDLKDVLQEFRRLNLEVIVVDQTTPEMKRNGLHCVKVLIPGMLSMTFGHHLTRVVGLERVLRVPAELGYAAQPLTLEQLNPHPHPFP